MRDLPRPVGFTAVIMEQVVGDAPTSLVWKTKAQLLYQTCMAHSQRIELYPLVFQTSVLTKLHLECLNGSG